MQILPGATAIVRNAAVLRPGERVVVVADERSRSVADHFVAAASAAGAEVRLVLIPLARSHGTAPPAAEACAIRAADVVLAATSFSLSHTPLRVEVASTDSAGGGRVPGSTVAFGLTIAGRNGETYSAAQITRDGENADAPTFRILNASGKPVASGKFEYG